MKTQKNSYVGKKIHFIGIGGVSMSALAKHLINNGAIVSGSERTRSKSVKEVQLMGAKVYLGHKKENVRGADVVVYSQAINDSNPELMGARKSSIEIKRRSQLLGEIIGAHKKSIGVSGSHGKTTVTAMLAQVLIRAGKDPTVFLGGEYSIFGNYRFGKESFAVVEACEYKKSFLDIKSDIKVVLNIDNDHLDCYKNMQEMVCTFKEYIDNSICVLNADDVNCQKLFNATTLTYGIENNATYRAKRITEKDGKYSFTAYASGIRLGRINLSIIGKHNVYNALSTVAVCDLLRIPFEIVKSSLESFNGVKRRNEYVGELFGKKCYCDYAHHPSEIKATLSAYKKSSENYLTVFQPHTYSRTKLLMQDFINVFKDVKPLIIMSTYSAREKFNNQGSAKTLVGNIVKSGNKEVVYVQNESELEKAIEQELTPNVKVIIFLGAGDIYEKAKNILVQKN